MTTSIRALRAEDFSVSVADRAAIKGELLNPTPKSLDIFFATDRNPIEYQGSAETKTWDIAVLFLIPKDAKPVSLKWKNLDLPIPKDFFSDKPE